MQEYPLFWMCMQPGELVQGRYAIRLRHTARCSAVTLLVLKMGPDAPSGQHSRIPIRCQVSSCTLLMHAGR